VNSKSTLIVGVAWLALGGSAGAAALPDGFYRYPSIGAGTIVFASEGDLWKVPASGGVAMRLTAYEGDERFPRVSPDGRWIAFTAQYEGNDDVYVMGFDGGEPNRLTYHPSSDQVFAWTADGKILFRSRRDSPNGDFRSYTIAPTGGIPSLIPLEPCCWVSYEPSGSRIAMQKIALEYHNWKRYRGGEAEELYVGSLTPLRFDNLTKFDGKDAFPMWAPDGRIYFVTDRWGRPNLASILPDGSDIKRLTNFEDYDVRWPSMGDGKIVYQHAADLWVYDLASGTNQMVKITLPSDRLQVRERFVDPMAGLRSWGLAPDGERIVLESRGDLFVARTKKQGLIRRITESSANRTKFPTFSPDGAWIAAWTEVDGEEQLVLRSSDNSAPPRQVGTQSGGWHFWVAWSPDSKRFAWGDQTHRLFVVDAQSGAAQSVDTSEWEISDYVWSPDSRYLAYTATLSSGLGQVRVWDGNDRTTHALSDPMVNSFSPTWDPDGKYLDFLSDRFINPFLDRFDARFTVDRATKPVIVALAADTKLPFAPRGDKDPVKDEKKDEKSKDDGKDSKKGAKGDAPKVEPIRIDWDGIQDRFVEVPVDPGNYYGLVALSGKLHWLEITNRGMFPPGSSGEDEEQDGGTLKTYDIEAEKLSDLASGVTGYDVSLDHKVLIYRTGDGFTRVEAGATSAPEGDGAKDAKVDLSNWTMRIDPRDEWKQMLREAWRLQRDFFYDPNMHGVDWNGVWQQYGGLLDRVASRDDVSDLLGEMLGELSVGHAYYWGGDIRRGKFVGTGLLAADLDYDDPSGFWKIKKIFRGDYPDPDWSSPLARPDLGVKEGMWLTGIDGIALNRGEDYLQRLANRAGTEVELSINTSPAFAGSRRVVVKPVGGDTMIRYATWVRENRAYVEKQSHGKIGYIHLYDMGGLGLRQFARDYPGQWNKRGLIIDDRWNHGGFVAPMIISHLNRRLFSVDTGRYGGMNTSPGNCFNGYMLCLINRQGGSDCETLAQMFKDFAMGPVVGTRTWGGWVGIRGDKALRDGGLTTQPEFSGYDPRGRFWEIEGHGVDPDVELDLAPDGTLFGHDAQLDYAIDDLMKKIAADPKDFPPPPPIIPRPLKPTK